MAKKVINGQAVIYTERGVEIVPAEVRRISNAHSDGLQFKNLQVPKDARYILIGGGKTWQDQPNNINAAGVMIENIEHAANYGKTKFFRLMLDLMKLAQFEPFAGVQGREMAFGFESFVFLKNRNAPIDSDIDFDLSLAEIDAQLYKKYRFTPTMIEFVEKRYAYDNG